MPWPLTSGPWPGNRHLYQGSPNSKLGSREQRPRGIRTVCDRLVQTALRLVLEPITANATRFTPTIVHSMTRLGSFPVVMSSRPAKSSNRSNDYGGAYCPTGE